MTAETLKIQQQGIESWELHYISQMKVEPPKLFP